jgi:SEC-C motif domain protein
MRSRYSAFCLLKMDYIGATVQGPAQKQFNKKASYEWANSVEFTGLTVFSAEQTAETGFVTFEACFKDKQSQQEDVIREKSEFNCIEQKWYYVKAINDSALSQTKRKQGRNDPCHCGSGQKYKKCCYSAEK